jgi:DNA-3-methyladenine glycosylase II
MARAASWRGVRVFTIGHSTRTLDELVGALRSFGVGVLADVRTVPRSRHNPQFDRAALGPALRARKIRYAQLPRLGGLRRTRRESPNTGWRNASFRGYADYMQTDQFAAGLGELRELAARGPVAIMCAEAVPWRCHRSLIADALTVRGAHVEHISGPGHARAHRLTPFAEVDGRRITYPPDERLETRAPFHLEATVRVLQRRPTNLVDVWERDRYLRVLRTASGLALVEVANRGTIDAPDVRLDVLTDVSMAVLPELGAAARAVLGLDVDPAPLALAAAAERGLAASAAGLRGLRPPRSPSLFEAFANVVPFQQVSLDSGAATVRRIVERLGESVEHEGRRFYAFPTADAVAGAPRGALERCGLSARKAESLRGLARAVQAGEISAEELERLPSDEAIARLTELPGIGPWSAGVVLLRGLRRLDVFPPGDVGVARGLGRLLRLRSAVSLDRVVRRFGDQRGYLYFFSLGSALLRKGLIRAAPSAA